MAKVKVTVWNEFIHERKNKTCKKLYPNGIHEQIAQYLRSQGDFEVQTATLDEKDHGLKNKVLDDTDVLIWWGHAAHNKVKDKIVDRVQEYILNGMGLIVLHSGHFSKIFKRMMGTSCGLTWREDAERELIWVVNPYHPITQGIEDAVFELEYTEMYGEFFDVPKPDDIIFISNFEGGEVFRSGMTFHRGRGKIFYFRPGHETYPIYHDENVLKVIANACRWCKFEGNTDGAPTINRCTHMSFSPRVVEDRGYEMEAIDHDSIHKND
ncbi:MAG: trehalose utilization protein ThuA [Candidatus Lokiarchaeota archaeon]|nr:trehalose utilization protein ThuA [Candidatus Lokiarchaeota archaeon]